MCVSVCLNVCMCSPCVWYPQKPDVGFVSSGTGVRIGCELPVGAGTQGHMAYRSSQCSELLSPSSLLRQVSCSPRWPRVSTLERMTLKFWYVYFCLPSAGRCEFVSLCVSVYVIHWICINCPVKKIWSKTKEKESSWAAVMAGPLRALYSSREPELGSQPHMVAHKHPQPQFQGTQHLLLISVSTSYIWYT